MLAGIGKSLAALAASKGSREALKATLPGAGFNAFFGLISGGPTAAVAYGVGDALVNYPLVRLARKVAPPTVGKLTLPTGKVVEHVAPSALEQGANFAGTMFSAPLVDLATGGRLYQRPQAEITNEQLQQLQLLNQQQAAVPVNNSQSQQTFQELLQRHRVNNLPMGSQALAPGTMFQTQGVEQTAFHYPGVTLPPEYRELMEGQYGI